MSRLPLFSIAAFADFASFAIFIEHWPITFSWDTPTLPLRHISLRLRRYAADAFADAITPLIFAATFCRRQPPALSDRDAMPLPAAFRFSAA